jgi:hypothetical protein
MNSKEIYTILAAIQVLHQIPWLIKYFRNFFMLGQLQSKLHKKIYNRR